jgi:hypothetical protein
MTSATVVRQEQSSRSATLPAESVTLTPAQEAFLVEAVPLYRQLVSGQLGRFGGYKVLADATRWQIAIDIAECSPTAFEGVVALTRLYFHLTDPANGPTKAVFGFETNDSGDAFEILLGGKSIGSIAIPRDGAR